MGCPKNATYSKLWRVCFVSFSEAGMSWFFHDPSHWHFFSPKPWQDFRSVSGERIVGRAVRRKVNGRWEYMNLDEDKLLDGLLLQKEPMCRTTTARDVDFSIT
jgi:hypothetical protein